ncbi:hypothetical protein ACJJTC_019745 [Scirpophaga incertulas]
MLSRLLRQFLFNLVHFVVTVLVATENVYNRLWIKKETFLSTEEIKNNIEVILKHIPNISKKPKHLVILTDTTQTSLKDLARVVIWSLVAGIPYVSFYDITGDLVKKEDKLFLEVQKYKKGVPGCIKWSHFQNLNGYTNGIPSHTIVVNIFTSDNGRSKIVQCIRQISQREIQCRRESHEFTAQELDEVLKLFYPSIPEPDLIMYTGYSCITYGFLPWQIRLTEFVHLSIDHCINVDRYIGALYKYNKCDQRFGK